MYGPQSRNKTIKLREIIAVDNRCESELNGQFDAHQAKSFMHYMFISWLNAIDLHMESNNNKKRRTTYGSWAIAQLKADE